MAESDKTTIEPTADEVKSKSHALPLAIGGIVFVLFVAVFSFKFGVFSSSNVTHIAVPVQQPQAVEEPEEFDAYEYDDYYPSYLSYDEGSDSTEMTEEDSLKHVAWYERQKNEIKQERLELERDKAYLDRLKVETQDLLDRRALIQDGNVIQMAKLYESMKSEELVPILSQLSDDQVSMLIQKMKKKKASDVLGKLPPERAARITQWLISLESN